MDKITLEDINAFREIMGLHPIFVSEKEIETKRWTCICRAEEYLNSPCMYLFDDDDLGALGNIEAMALRDKWKTYLKLIDKDFL